MSSRKRPNRPPNNTEITALNELIAQEEEILASIQKLEREREKERVRLFNKSCLLQRTLQSTKVIQDVASTMCSSNEPLHKELERELAFQEAEVSTISEYFPSTKDFMMEFRTIVFYVRQFQSALKAQLQSIGDRINSINEELESTDDLRDYMVDAVSSISTMVSTTMGTIQKKRQGLLHPIRRLPAEMLEEIFLACVHEETRGWLDDPARTPDLPKAATRVASVCRFWRSVALQCPRLWRCLRAPTQYNKPIPYRPYNIVIASGVDHFRNSLQLRGGAAVELTIPYQASIPIDIDIMAVPIDRLNLLNVASEWPPAFPSPLHLWLGQPATNNALTRAIPSSLIARTKTITTFSVGLTFETASHSISRLIISGRQPKVPFIPLLTSLPNLAELDAKDARVYESPAEGTQQALDHLRLRRIRLDSSCLEALEQSLSDGLKLPQLRSLTLSNLISVNIPSLYPSFTTQLSATVTSLDIHETASATTIRRFIDKFHRTNTLSISGTSVNTALRTLYSQRKTSGGQEIRRIREMPKGLEKLIIQNYYDDGSKIHKNLRMMRSNPATDTQPIKVIFEGCPNIRKDIREEFARALPEITVEFPRSSWSGEVGGPSSDSLIES